MTAYHAATSEFDQNVAEDKVIPLENSLRLSRLIPRSQLHVFGRCGHWTQIEHASRFAQLVSNFLAEAG